MNNIREIVDLPDPAVQPLVHPLDLPEARRSFRRSWLVGTLTDPAVALCLAAIIWFMSRSYVVPLIATAATLGFGALASRYLRREAWAFVPRKRQDRHRPLPIGWELGSSLVLAVAVSVALVLLSVRLGQPDIPGNVRQFTFGMAAATGVLVVGDLIAKLLRHRGRERRQAWFTLPVVLAVVGGILVSHRVLFGASASWSTSLMLWGAATMSIVGAGVGVWKYVDGGHAPTGSDRPQ